jgi:hypothetical protein
MIPEKAARTILAGSSKPDRSQLWMYGNEYLWVVVPKDGVVRGAIHDGGVDAKFPTVPLVGGSLSAVVRRIDGAAPPAGVWIEGGATAGGSLWAFGVWFSTPGCWEITQRVQDKQLRFVVKVVGDAKDAEACNLSPLAQQKPESANSASFTDTWYSNHAGSLWAGLDRGHEGRWTAGRGIKVLWVKPERTALTATATALGGDGRVVDFTIPGPGDFELPYQASGIECPFPGCWRIAGSAGSERLVFVVLVEGG